jgi:hypothetical protein
MCLHQMSTNFLIRQVDHAVITNSVAIINVVAEDDLSIRSTALNK